jgi:hypothetical protein
MSLANRRWGAPRIHGELLKLDIDIGETTIAKYMVRARTPSPQTWKTFLKNNMRPARLEASGGTIFIHSKKKRGICTHSIASLHFKIWRGWRFRLGHRRFFQ